MSGGMIFDAELLYFISLMRNVSREIRSKQKSVVNINFMMNLHMDWSRFSHLKSDGSICSKTRIFSPSKNEFYFMAFYYCVSFYFLQQHDFSFWFIFWMYSNAFYAPYVFLKVKKATYGFICS